MSNPSDRARALDDFVERVRGEFGDEAADEVRASISAFRSEVWFSGRLCGIEGASRKEARRAFERAVDQAAKRMDDDPLARRVRKDGGLKDLIADWLFELYLEETGGDGHRTSAKPPLREKAYREPHVTQPEKNGFHSDAALHDVDSPPRGMPDEAPPIPRPAPKPSSTPTPEAAAEPEPDAPSSVELEPDPPSSTDLEPDAPSPAELEPDAPSSVPLTGPRPDPVFLDVCAPKSVRPGDRFSAELSAYVRAFEAEAREAMENLGDPGSEVQQGVKAGRWAVDAPVTVRLLAPDLTVEAPERNFVWDGEYQTLDFRVSVPADAPSRRTTLTFEVIVAGLATEVTLDIEVGAAASAEMARARGRTPASAFVSYSHKDLDEVFKRVASMQTFHGADFFVDRDGLVMSEHWSEGLRRAILEREVFLLFWSRNAEASAEVRKEWEFALERKGLKAMQVHLLELVDVKKMPEPFNDLHLDSKWLRLIDHPPVAPSA